MHVGHEALVVEPVELHVEADGIGQARHQGVAGAAAEPLRLVRKDEFRTSAGGFGQSLQVFGPHLDQFGGLQGTHHRQLVLREAPVGGKDFLRGMRIDRDVPLCRRGGVALVVEAAAHDHQPLEQLRQFRFPAEGEGEVGQRTCDEAGDLAGVLPHLVHPDVHGVPGRDLLCWRRQFRVADPLRPVGFLRGDERDLQRHFGPDGHLYS
ncbi:hypothetical protein D9M72_369500 [compost metagenome]